MVSPHDVFLYQPQRADRLHGLPDGEGLMTTTFYNITISIEAETEVEAYLYLSNVLDNGPKEKLEYMTEEFNSELNGDLRDTSELWPDCWPDQHEKGAS